MACPKCGKDIKVFETKGSFGNVACIVCKCGYSRTVNLEIKKKRKHV